MGASIKNLEDNGETNRDEELIKAHLAGSEAAFRHLVESHSPDLIATLERMLGDHHLALDVAQEVFIKLHAMLPRYRFTGRFRALLYAMALNRSRDELRRRKRSRLVLLDHRDSREEETRSHNPARTREQREVIEEALGKVPEPFREAVHLRDVVGLSYLELATALGLEMGTVKSRVNRGRLAFRDRYLELTRDRKPEGENHAS